MRITPADPNGQSDAICRARLRPALGDACDGDCQKTCGAGSTWCSRRPGAFSSEWRAECVAAGPAPRSTTTLDIDVSDTRQLRRDE
jgi:hypothetical protein